jgi:hypothetical protein
MERIASLMVSKRYPKDMVTHYENDFRYARHLVNPSREKKYEKIVLLCNNNNWLPDDSPDKEIIEEPHSVEVDQLTANLPTPNEVKKLTIMDTAIMGALAGLLRERLQVYIVIDPYTVPDPFEDKDDYNYSVVVDRESLNRIIAITAASKKPGLAELPWDTILYDRLIRRTLNKHQASELKSAVMPKETNNFYPYRRDTQFHGCIMFAFQICGVNINSLTKSKDSKQSG